MKFLHELDDAQGLFEIVTDEIGIAEPYLVEKDYWIMHSLWGLQCYVPRFFKEFVPTYFR